MTRPAGRAALLRWLTGLLLLLVALMHPGQVSAQSGAGPVRTGVTVEEPPPAPPPIPDAHETPPSDAPRIARGSSIAIPAPPASFNTHDAGWIRFSYQPAVRERVQPLITEADAVRADLRRRLGQSVLDKVTVYVARTPGEMSTLAPEGAPFPKYAAGVAYSDLGFVLLTLQPVHPNSRHDLTEVFRHELAHVALHDAVSGSHVPRWFNEGFAVFASGESSFPRLQTLWTATVANDLLPLARLERSFPEDAATASVAYAQAADVLRFLMRKQDQQRFHSLIERVRSGQRFELAMKDAYGVDLAGLEYEWREDVARRYTFWPVLFSGSIVWALAIGLFGWAWRRRKRRDRETLARWAREEAREDALRLRLAQQEERMHIVLARTPRDETPRPLPPEVGVPKVEHDGSWHTLH